MIKVKMKATAAGPNGTFMSGKDYSMDDKQAREFVEGGYAEALEPFLDADEPEGDNSSDDGTDDDAGSEGTETANQEPKEGEVNEPEGDNSSDDGTDGLTNRETAPKNRRNR